MKVIILFITLLFCTTVHAQVAPTEGWGHPPPHHYPRPHQKQKQYQEQKQHQYQDQQQHQKAKADANANANATADASNNGVNNDTTVLTEAVRNAPSVSLGGVFPTAACQSGIGIGGSGVNGSGLLSFAFTKKECSTVVLAQNFMAIGMPETSCELLKTTKSFARAMKANPQLRADCDRPVAVVTPPPATAPAALVPVPVTDDPQGG